MLTGLKSYAMRGAAIAFALVLAWGLRVDHLRGQWKARFYGLSGEVTVVLPAIREASNNPKLQWRPGVEGDAEGVAAQLRFVGASRQQERDLIRQLSDQTAEEARESARLKAYAEKKNREYMQAIAQRNTALAKLDKMALTPGERQTCEQQLAEAEMALDLAFGAGI